MSICNPDLMEQLYAHFVPLLTAEVRRQRAETILRPGNVAGRE
jgi:hypothetical protein